jgi:hypothetical protein
MPLSVEYFRDRSDPKSKCWSLLPLSLSLEDAQALARDGLADARLLGARGFRILNQAGRVMATS